MKPDTLIFVIILVISLGAFALESAGPDGARIVGIAFCLLLVTAIVMGSIARYGRKRRAEGEALMQASEENEAPAPNEETAQTS